MQEKKDQTYEKIKNLEQTIIKYETIICFYDKSIT